MDEVAAPPLLALPSELIHHILTFIPPTTIATVSVTCHLLRQHTLSDRLWQPIVNANLPKPLADPAPLASFRDLYIAHHPYWFLTKHQLWYADSEPNGKLLVARYDPRRGCIEGYAVVAERGLHTWGHWEHDDNVAIHSFNPRIQLDLNQPVLKLDIGSPRAKIAAARRRQPLSMSNWFRPASSSSSSSSSSHNQEQDSSDIEDPLPPLSREIIMDTSAPTGLYTSFMLSRDHPAAITSNGTAVWPPLRIPALSRTRNASIASFAGTAHRPKHIDEVSQHTFRLRKWIEFANRAPTGTTITNIGTAEERLYAAMQYGIPAQHLLRGIGGQSVRMGEDVATFGTLPLSAYTPTAEKPWRGIWCGDYSGHGCEFLVMLQPDDGAEAPLPQGMNWMGEWLRTGKRREAAASASTADEDSEEEDEDNELEDESDDEVWEDAFAEAEAMNASLTQREGNKVDRDVHSGDHTTRSPYSGGGYTGRIEAIKLTGDPNIPRGQYTFIAPDISDSGLVRIAEETVFKGARVVRSAGHIADRGYVSDKYIPSQLILISHDRMAQYWEGFGHISFYQRVDINALLHNGM